MDSLQKMIDAQLAGLPRLALEQHVRKKLKAAGVVDPGFLPREIADHILSSTCEPFQSPGSPEITLSFTIEDVRTVEHTLTDFLDSKLPQIVEQIVDDTASLVLKSLKKRWRAEHAAQQADVAAFRDRLEQRWGNALHLLRMLLTVAREWGQAVYERKRGRATIVDDVLLRLHVRSCQVTEEIIVC
jgi:hypothetical protein